MTTSTVSKLSRPRSLEKWAVGLTWAEGCVVSICGAGRGLTRLSLSSSTENMYLGRVVDLFVREDCVSMMLVERIERMSVAMLV